MSDARTQTLSSAPAHRLRNSTRITSPEALTGRRVVGEINAACHRCEPCRNGRPTHCDHRTVLGIKDRNGAFAEYLRKPSPAPSSPEL